MQAIITQIDTKLAANPRFNQNINAKLYLEETHEWVFVEDGGMEYRFDTVSRKASKRSIRGLKEYRGSQ